MEAWEKRYELLIENSDGSYSCNHLGMKSFIREQRKQAQLEMIDKVLGEVSIIHDKGYVRTCDIEKLREELK